MKHYKNSKDGISKLENNYHAYNGVILDAKCFKDKEAEKQNILSNDEIEARSLNVRRLTKKIATSHIVFILVIDLSSRKD